ncbi:amidohydrolase family protein [Herbiconiux sp. CPCC 205763]|uniref:Amidohydrolase family protein n=1 Tax=Herbiconiux aconitum TaxID=2970913 RepID=A0ABT2GR82_9MICO|nr:amidohydrolase family protein [Herbiconiux aconitum]MCS5718683.1 amidohydrolase family protein [Herbiconiux aconitum]
MPGETEPVDVTIADGRVMAVVPAGRGDFGRTSTGASPVEASLSSTFARNDSASAERIDLEGRWVIPGLWDNHVHFSAWAAVSRRLDVSAARSAAEVIALVRDAMDGRPRATDGVPTGGAAVGGGVLVGFGFRDGLWADEPTAAGLDAVSGGRPVVLVSGDLHCCWLNSAALTRFGRAGHPTGVLREDDAFAVQRALDDVPTATIDAWALDAARAAAARGVVGVVDLEMAWNHDVWRRRAAAGHDLLRVEFGIYPQHLDRAIAAGLRTGDVVDGGIVRVGPFKVITDGSLNTRTAYCFDEYPGLEGRPDSRGLLTVPPAELEALLARATAAGLMPAVHAIGDHANTLVLDAFERIGCSGSLEHAQLLALADIPRFAALGVVASVQPEHAMDDRDVADRFWAGRTGRSFALASLLEAGAALALGSDAPVAPLDPWVTMAAAVGRTRDGREPWHPEQRISAAAALAASTRAGTRIRVGAPADLAVTDLDPLVPSDDPTAAADRLRTIPVALTLLAGRATHRTL